MNSRCVRGLLAGLCAWMLCGAMMACPAFGDDMPTGKILFPKQPAVVQPEPSPAPKPTADVPKLAADVLYVIESDEPFILLSSPCNLAQIDQESTDGGTLKIRGVFFDGTGKPEFRTYKSKYLAIVTAQSAGRVELLAVPVGVTEKDQIVRQLLDIGAGPRPPPDVDPVEPPKPVPTGFRVLFVYESQSPQARNFDAILNSTKVAAYLNGKCIKNGTLPEWRKWDKDVVIKSTESQTMAQLWNDNKATMGTLPQVFLTANGKGQWHALPANIDDMLKLLKTYGGE